MSLTWMTHVYCRSQILLLIIMNFGIRIRLKESSIVPDTVHFFFFFNKYFALRYNFRNVLQEDIWPSVDRPSRIHLVNLISEGKWIKMKVILERSEKNIPIDNSKYYWRCINFRISFVKSFFFIEHIYVLLFIIFLNKISHNIFDYWTWFVLYV